MLGLNVSYSYLAAYEADPEARDVAAVKDSFNVQVAIAQLPILSLENTTSLEISTSALVFDAPMATAFS